MSRKLTRMPRRICAAARHVAAATVGAVMLLAVAAVPFAAPAAAASPTWAPYLAPINTNANGYGGYIEQIAAGPVPGSNQQTLWAGGEAGYCVTWGYGGTGPYCTSSGYEPAAWWWNPGASAWYGPITTMASQNPQTGLNASFAFMTAWQGKMMFAINYSDPYGNWAALVDSSGNEVAGIPSGAYAFSTGYEGHPEPGPNGSILTVMQTQRNGTAGYQFNTDGSTQMYPQPNSEPNIVGLYGHIYNFDAGEELVNGSWQAGPIPAVGCTNPLWGSDARMWCQSGNGVYEWNGSNWVFVTSTSGSEDVVLGPNGMAVWWNGTDFYQIQNGPTVSSAPSLTVTLQGNWTTWGQEPATTSFNGSSLVAQGYDGNQQDWGNVTYRIGDVNPDGPWFNTQYVSGGAVGTETSLPTRFGHLYSIMAAAQYLDPADRGLAVGGTVAYGPTVNYFLPSNTPNVAQIAGVTSTSITVDWPTVWNNGGQQMYLSWEPGSLASQNNWTGIQSSPHIAYPQHSYTITGLSPGTTYWISVAPLEPSGGAPFGVGWWQVTTDTAPSGSIRINNGATVTQSQNVTLSVTATGGKTPPVAVRFSSDNSNWGPWQKLSGTPATGTPSVGGAGSEGHYYAANTSLSANQSGSDYGHYNNFLYSELDPQIDFPYGAWPSSPNGQAPQRILNSGSPTNTGADWGAIWQGYLYAPVSGTYHFAMPNDDFASLTIDGQDVLEEYCCVLDPQTTNASISLVGGQWYPYEIQYWQAPGGAAMQLEWQQPVTSSDPNPSFAVVPSSDLWDLSPGYSTTQNNGVSASGTYSWQLPLGTTGTQYVYAQFLSLDGTVSPAVSASILELINNNPPTVSLTLDGGKTSTSSTSVSALISAQGSGLSSGQGQMRFQVDSGSWTGWQPFASTATVTIPGTVQTHTVTVEVEDQNGLTSEANAQIAYVNPTTQQQTSNSGVLSVTGASGTITLNGQTVVIVPSGAATLQFTPSTTPVFVRVTQDGAAWSPWLPYVSTMPVGLNLNEVNPVSAQFKFSDSSESQPYTLQVLPLTKAPTFTASWQGGVTATTTGSMTAVMSVSDAAIPVTALQYSVNGGATWAAVPGASFTASVPLPASGANTITLEVRDPAGQTSSVTLTAWKL